MIIIISLFFGFIASAPALIYRNIKKRNLNWWQKIFFSFIALVIYVSLFHYLLPIPSTSGVGYHIPVWGYIVFYLFLFDEEKLVETSIKMPKDTFDKRPKDLIVDQIYLECLSKKIKYFSENRTDSQDFLNIFPSISIEPGYSLPMLLYRQNLEENPDERDVSCSDKMNKIFISNDANSYIEFLAFNFYANVFFNGDEYDGKLILSDIDKNDIINMRIQDKCYTQEEKNLIKELDIPQSIVLNEDDSVQIEVIEADDSFEVRKVKYTINKNQSIVKISEIVLISCKILY